MMVMDSEYTYLLIEVGIYFVNKRYTGGGYMIKYTDIDECGLDAIIGGNRVYSITLLFFTTPSLLKKVLKYMSEILVTRRSSRKNGGATGVLTTEVITSTKTWVAPSNRINQYTSVRIFGGGGGGRMDAAGGGGWMNNGVFNIPNGQYIAVTIGSGGVGGTLNKPYHSHNLTSVTDGDAGGTTSFGTYLSANGSSATSGGKSSEVPGIGGSSGGARGAFNKMITAGQFGGGSTGNKSDGGVWGGGGGAYGGSTYAGNGGTYGGGGGTSSRVGGNGGTYGGGGGISGIGGAYGGNGGATNNNGNNGTNTSTWTNVMKDDKTGAYLRGWGRGGSVGGGGGGYGGNGGNTYGGGGGYGSSGGNINGGGGGYGGNGGSSWGGGGGYCGDGGWTYGGGGGYYAKGGNNIGGGGAYGYGGDGNFALNGTGSNGLYGGGGGGFQYAYDSTTGKGGSGGSGICVIQYYVSTS